MMATTDIDVLRCAVDWSEQGYRVVLATVIQTWGSAPRKAGSHMIVREDGQFVGSVSGGCVEGAVIQEVLSLECRQGREIAFGVSTEEAWEVGLSCGGEVRIWLERVSVDVLRTVIAQVEERKSCALQFFLDGFEPMTIVYGAEEQEDSSPKSIVEVPMLARRIYHPPRRVFVIGAVHIAQAFSPMAQRCGYEVVLIDPRAIFLQPDRWEGERFRRLCLYPDECLPQEQLDCRDAVVALSHDPKIDDIALRLALEANVFYVGALGSRKNHARRSKRLAEEWGCAAEDISRISGPIGLDIGSTTPAEIAVSILAEMIAAQRQG